MCHIRKLITKEENILKKYKAKTICRIMTQKPPAWICKVIVFLLERALVLSPPEGSYWLQISKSEMVNWVSRNSSGRSQALYFESTSVASVPWLCNITMTVAKAQDFWMYIKGKIRLLTEWLAQKFQSSILSTSFHFTAPIMPYHSQSR